MRHLKLALQVDRLLSPRHDVKSNTTNTNRHRYGQRAEEGKEYGIGILLMITSIDKCILTNSLAVSSKGMMDQAMDTLTEWTIHTQRNPR